MTPLTAMGTSPAIFLSVKSTAPALLLSATGGRVTGEHAAGDRLSVAVRAGR